MISNAAQLLRWYNGIKQEERDLRVWMHSAPETSRVMDYIDHVDVLPELVVPLLKAYKERHLYGDAIPESQIREMINALHSADILPSLVSIIPSDWDSNRITMIELAIIASKLETHYPGIRDELNGENWKANSLALIKAICTLEVHARIREQESYRLNKGHIRPGVGDHYLSEDVARFILDNPDQGEEIVSVMLTRRTRNFEFIRSIINSDAKALSAGAL